jgi:PAS domain S-box-containing protein
MASQLHETHDICLLGDAPFQDLERVVDAVTVPDGVRTVVVEISGGLKPAVLDTLRRRHPQATLVARLRADDTKNVEPCVVAGFDVIAVGDRHLELVLNRFRRETQARRVSSTQQQLQESLISLINEINDRPGLGDVLKIAVLRMSQLFSIERVSVVLFQPGEDVAFVVAEHEKSLVDNIVIRISDYPELQAVIKSREPLVIPDVLGDALLLGVRAKIEHAQTPPRAAVLFPLLHKGAVVGAVFLRGHEPMERVEDQLLTMGRLIASVTSVAVGSALEHDTLLSEQRKLLRKKAETDEKVAGLQQFSEFFAQAHDGIVVADRTGAIRYANGAAGKILRREPDLLMATTFVDLFAPHSQVLAERALRGDDVGDTYGYVDLLARTEGDVETVISAAIRALSHTESVLISFRDVTELREIESELRQTKEFLENLIQSSVDAIVAADIDGRIILFNRAAERFLGHGAREVVGQATLDAFFAPGEAADVMRRLRSEAYGGRGRLESTRKDLVSKTGDVVPVTLTASIIYEGDKEVAIVGVFTDLRERLKMEEKLSQVQRRLQSTERQAVAVELAGAAAHELNQPLTSILGYAEMLRRHIGEADVNRKPVDVICRETERMAAIVRKIGQITAYQTKAYVGGSQILDLDSGGEPAGGPDKSGATR